MSSSGRIIASKHCRDALPPSVPAEAFERIQQGDAEAIFELGMEYICVWTYGSDSSVLYLAVAQEESEPLYILSFLRRLDNNLRISLNPVRENGREQSQFDQKLLRKKRSVLVQILEEVLDGGFATNMEPNVTATLIPQLRAGANGLIATMNVAKAIKIDTAEELLPQEATSALPWRRAGVIRPQNAIYFDVIEAINATIGADGRPLMLSVQGRIRVSCLISGTPDVELHVNEPNLLTGATVHPCVRYRRLERRGVLSFVPPDGEFDLCQYTCNRVLTSNAIPLRVVPSYQMSPSGTGSFKLEISATSSENPVSDLVADIVLSNGLVARDIQQVSGSARTHIYYDQDAHLIKVSINRSIPPTERAKLMVVDLEEPGIPELVTNQLKINDQIVIQCMVQDRLYVPASCVLEEDEDGHMYRGGQECRSMPSPFRPTVSLSYSLAHQAASGLRIRSVEIKMDPETNQMLKGEKPFRGSRSISLANDVVYLC